MTPGIVQKKVLFALAAMSLLPAEVAEAATCAIPGQYFDFESALANPDCDTIEIQGGAYDAGLTVDRSVTIQGVGPGATVLNGPGGIPTLTIAGSSHVKLEGLTLTAPSSNDIALSKENGATLDLVDFGVSAQPQTSSRVFLFPIEGAQEVPPVKTAASGSCSLTLTGLSVDVLCSYQNLSSIPVFSHLHLAPAGNNGPVFVTLTVTAATTGTITGGAELTSEQVTELRAGRVYLNLHTQDFPAGELRGQVLPFVPPARWPEEDGGNGQYYSFIEAGVTWQEARVLAALMSYRGLSGRLVTIGNSAENDFLTGLAPDNAEPWIGLNDIDNEGNFVWITNEPLVFTKWAENEPNDFNGEDAVTLLGLNGEWNDLSETALRSFLVEFDPDWDPRSIFIDGFEPQE